MKRLYLVRHGETEGNKKRTITGPKTVLSKEGEKQARELAKRFRNIAIDKVFCSSYPRAQQTYALMRDAVKLEPELTDLLTEKRPASSLIGTSLGSPELIKFNELSQAHRTEHGWHFEDEENMHDIFGRAVQFLELAKKAKESNILAVTHGGFLRYTLAAVLSRSSVEILNAGVLKTTIHANTGITVCQLNDDNDWELRTWNDFAHLGDTHEVALRSPLQKA